MATATNNFPNGSALPADKAAPLSPATGPLLARANLLRMRGQWDEAIAACTEVLRQTPDSATAHALLGDIYEAQGKTDDALQWFSMAVELDPANAADRAKFDRLAAAQREKMLAEQKAGQHSPKAAKEKTLDWIDRQFPPGRSESIARLIWIMSGIMTVLILGCAGFLYLLSQNNRLTANGRSISSPLAVKSPVVIAPLSANVEAVPMPSAGAQTKTGSASENPNALREKIAAQLKEMTVLSAQTDTMQQIVLRISVPSSNPAESVEQKRERIVRSAARAAWVVAQAEPEAKTAQIVVFLPPAAGAATPVFTGTLPLETTRKTDLSLASTGEILAQFTQLEWALPEPSPASPAAPRP